MREPEREAAVSQHAPEGLELLRSPDLQPEKYTTPEGAESAFDAVRAETNKIALTEGPSTALAEAIARESMMLMRKEQLRAYAQGGAEIAGYKHFADGELTDAAELFSYANGGATLSDQVRRRLQNRIDEVNTELDALGNDFSHNTITELRGATDKLSLHRFEAEYRELARLRHGVGNALPAVESPQSPSHSPNLEATQAQAINEARQRVLEATGAEGIGVPSTEPELRQFEKDEFSAFEKEEVDAKKLDQLRAFLQAKVRAKQERHQDPNIRYPDTVAAVLGNGGEASTFLAKYINTRAGENDRITEVNQLLRMRFSDVVQTYLGMDITATNPGYFNTFRQ